MLEFGALASRWWIPVLFIVVAGHITNVCVTLFLHRAQTHRGVRLHAIAAVPMTDTVKEAGPSGLVERTLERDRLWAVQTPQVFRADVLRRALDASTEVLAAATDDASLVERAGGTVRVVESPPDNLKVTTDLDLRMAEAILRSRC